MEALEFVLYIVVGIVLVILCAKTKEGTSNKALVFFTILYFFPVILVANLFINDIVAPSKK